MTALTPAYMARLAAKARNLADDFEEAGYVETPDWLRAIADITEGKFPCGHEPGAEPQGPPVDGREVDRAPEDVVRPHECQHTPHVQEIDEGDSIVFRHCCCPIGKFHTETGGGAAGNPPAASADEEVQGTSGGESDPVSAHLRHLWLRVEDSRQWEDCRCLIGDDHVAEPRFEKES